MPNRPTVSAIVRISGIPPVLARSFVFAKFNGRKAVSKSEGNEILTELMSAFFNGALV